MWAACVRRPSVSMAFFDSVIPLPADASLAIRAVRRNRSSWATDHWPGSGAAVTRVAAKSSESVRIDHANARGGPVAGIAPSDFGGSLHNLEIAASWRATEGLQVTRRGRRIVWPWGRQACTRRLSGIR